MPQGLPPSRPARRIAIVGPIAPLRSGIARYTGALAAELASRPGTTVKVFSFQRQYPAFLFPGEGQEDASLALPAGVAVDRPIDSLDPLSWRRTARAVQNFRPDAVIVPAWTFFVAPALGAISLMLRKAGLPVHAMVHNARDHEAAGWKNRLLAFQIGQADKAAAHNDAVASDVRRIAPGLAVKVCPHPLYDDYPPAAGTLQRRAGLELLFFGLVRPYKGLDILLDALARGRRGDVRLTIAGEFWSGLDATRDRIAGHCLGGIVDLVPRYVSDAEAAELFARCDALVAPYRSATGSGVLALAQHYQRPVIASDVPGLADAVADGRTGRLFPAGDVDALASILADSDLRAQLDRMGPALKQQRESLTWQRLANTILN